MEAYGGCNQEETSLEKHCPGMQNAKSKLSWNWNWWVMWTAMRRAFTGTLQPKGEPRISRELTDIEHEKGSSTQCLLHLGLHWQDQAFWVSVPSGRWEVLPTTAEEDLSRDHLCKLDTYKKVYGPRWGASECTLRDQAKVIARLLSIMLEKTWQSGKVPMTRKANVTPVFKKGKKGDSNN